MVGSTVPSSCECREECCVWAASRGFGAAGSSATLTGVKVSAGARFGSERASLTSPLPRACRRHMNSWLGLMPRCRATCDTEWTGRQASSTSWSFSSSLQRRRRSDGDYFV